MRVIDTDYTSFLLLYQCREEYEGVDDIETALTTDKDYNKIHHQAISILVRDPNSMTEERIEELIQTLKEKVPGHDFSRSHERQVQDAEKCPKGDLFKSEGAISQKQIMDLIEEHDGPEIHDEL